jgi:membrane protein implicated in regulation of membrane protease activity
MALEWLIAITLTLFIIDLFVEDETPSWIAMLTLATYFTAKIDPSFKWWFVVYFCILSIIFSLYYLFFRNVLLKISDKTWWRNSPNETIDRIIGKKGCIRIINGVTMVKWDDELWHVANADALSLADGDKVIVEAFADGQATVKKCK